MMLNVRHVQCNSLMVSGVREVTTISKIIPVLISETSRFASAAMVVVVTLDRYIAVSRPLSTSHWRYPQTARKVP